jgi:hypothetical protein
MDTKRNPEEKADRRSLFQRLVQRREANEKGRRGEQRYSLEGLRLAGLLKQMQALQAIQGLQELAPRKPGTPARLSISPDPDERARQRQWLEFKADWLQAMLEDALGEIEMLDRFKAGLATEAGNGAAAATATNGSEPGGNGQALASGPSAQGGNGKAVNGNRSEPGGNGKEPRSNGKRGG